MSHSAFNGSFSQDVSVMMDMAVIAYSNDAIKLNDIFFIYGEFVQIYE